MASINKVLQMSSRRAANSLKILPLRSSTNLCTKLLCGGNGAFNSSSQSHFSMDRDRPSNILSQSTILVQDGLDIEELPILIRYASKDSFPFTTSHTYAGEKVGEQTEFDTTFRELLQNCSSVNDVFRLLEVPSSSVRGYSAAFALERLHTLKTLNTEWSSIHSFIRSAVMRELYDTVQRDVKQLANSTLISLVECYMAAVGFSLSCLDTVNTEIQIRLADGVFTVEELLTLARILARSKDLHHSQDHANRQPLPKFPFAEDKTGFLKSSLTDDSSTEHFDRYAAKENFEVREEIKSRCRELVNNVWIHLNLRCSDVDEHTFPTFVEALPPEHKSMMSLLEKPLMKMWTGLSVEGVAACLDTLLRLRVNNSTIMTCLGRWAYVNIHQMSPQLLLSFVHTFNQFCFTDENLIKVMGRCLRLKGENVSTDIVAMCVEYCRSSRVLSPVVLDVAAKHFTQHGYSYEPLQMYAVLRAFGQLNYLPSHPSEFLKMVESCVLARFDILERQHLLEILGSFILVDILPHAFAQRIASDQFFYAVGQIKTDKRSAALKWLKLIKYTLFLSQGHSRELSLEWMSKRRSKFSVYFDLEIHTVAIHCIRSALSEIVGPDKFYIMPFYDSCVLCLNKDRMPLPLYKSQSRDFEFPQETDKVVAIILRSANHFLLNTHQLIGIQAHRLRQMKSLGMTVVVSRVTNYLTTDNPVEFLREELTPHVNFDLLPDQGSDTAGHVDEEFLLEEDIDMEEDIAGEEDIASEEVFSSDDEDGFKDLVFSLEDKAFGDANVSVDDSGLLKDKKKFKSDDETHKK